MRVSDFEYSLDKLYDSQLINKSQKYVTLTSRGKLLVHYVTRSHYKDLCKEMLDVGNTDDLFWELLDVPVDHSLIAIDMMTFKKPVLVESAISINKPPIIS